MRGALPLIAAALATVAALAVMWNPGSDDAGAGPYLPGNERYGSGLSQVPDADCTQWADASLRQRHTVVLDLGEHFGHESTFWEGSKLPDGEAYEVIDNACSNSFARRFKLYKIYVHAMAFRPYGQSG